MNLKLFRPAQRRNTWPVHQKNNPCCSTKTAPCISSLLRSRLIQTLPKTELVETDRSSHADFIRSPRGPCGRRDFVCCSFGTKLVFTMISDLKRSVGSMWKPVSCDHLHLCLDLTWLNLGICRQKKVINETVPARLQQFYGLSVNLRKYVNVW